MGIGCGPRDIVAVPLRAHRGCLAFTTAGTPTWPAAGITLALPTLLVSVERVQSGAQYSSEVVAGAALGLLSAWLTRQVPHCCADRPGGGCGQEPGSGRGGR
jgi:undecaprenyl-diphosphatase